MAATSSVLAPPAPRPRAKPARFAQLGQLWQVPLLLVAVGSFGVAAYLFIDPRGGPTIDQKVDLARQMIKAERPEAAINTLNRILLTEKLDRDHEGVVHLLEGQALEQLQLLKHLSLKTYHEQVVDQTALAESMGVRPTCEIERRLGDSCEALGRQVPALEHFRKAAALDPTHALRLQRKVIELQLAVGDTGPAGTSLSRYLQAPDLSDGERAWALCNQAKLLVDQGEFVRGRGLLERASRLDCDDAMRGQLKYYQGYCAARTGDPAGAEALLRAARLQLRPDNPLDADAACLLGQLAADRGDARVAASFFRDVLVNHPESPRVPAALLGRGLARLADPNGTDDAAGVRDLSDLTKRMVAAEPPSPASFTADVTSGLNGAATTLAGRGNAAAAIDLLDCQRQLSPPTPTAKFFHQLSAVFEARAGQVERGMTPEAGGDRQTAADLARRTKDARALLIHAADASVAEARQLTMSDDKGYGQALWHGIDLYDRAADVPASIEALQLFVAERPSDPLAPTALLRLGHAYQAAGQYDKAIATYQQNQFLYPNSLAASKSAVPLAAAYVARGPADYPRAEAVLRNVLEGNPLLTPEADEYRQALFELGHLYYRTEQYDKAIGRLGEYTTRYGNDDRFGQALFLTADSYRKSADLLATKATADGPTTRPGPADLAEATAARRQRLELARGGYDAVVQHFAADPPRSELDRTYNKLAHFDRADCLYDTGRYEEAIRQYDAAAFRYQDDPASLAAYVQIVNAYNALGKPDEAHATNERAKVMLRQMPSAAFSNGTTMTREYWENQLRWNSGSAMY